jgi:hypothetical protein
VGKELTLSLMLSLAQAQQRVLGGDKWLPTRLRNLFSQQQTRSLSFLINKQLRQQVRSQVQDRTKLRQSRRSLSAAGWRRPHRRTWAQWRKRCSRQPKLWERLLEHNVALL